MDKKIIMIGMVFGSMIGGYIPSIFGAGIFSISSVICGAIGGIIGIWITFRFLD
jgi:outer membrane lipoprotein SlyB